MAYKFTPVASKFVPRRGQSYRFIGVGPKNQLSLLIGTRTWTGDKHDYARLSMNNVFPTLEAAQKARTAIEVAIKVAAL